MKRRTFIHTAVAAGSFAAAPRFAGAEEPAGKSREFFELREYILKPGDKSRVLHSYFEKALIPTLNRLGIKQVGVMTDIAETSPYTVTLLIPYQSLEQLAGVNSKLTGDDEYLKSAAEYLAAPATDPVYARIESSLLAGIEGMPRLEAPPKKSRLFNLRIYESHNEAAGKKKIEMFNTGELAIFRRVGLTPVLFGEAILGTRLPNLTYLLVFDDDKARMDAWNRFRADPEWQKLRAIPEYEDKRIVSRITNKLLTPAEYSQI